MFLLIYVMMNIKTVIM